MIRIRRTSKSQWLLQRDIQQNPAFTSKEVGVGQEEIYRQKKESMKWQKKRYKIDPHSSKLEVKGPRCWVCYPRWKHETFLPSSISPADVPSNLSSCEEVEKKRRQSMTLMVSRLIANANLMCKLGVQQSCCKIRIHLSCCELSVNHQQRAASNPN